MRSSKKFYAVGAAAVTTAALAVGLAGTAGASSRTPSSGGGSAYNCANGIYAAYCGTQESGTGLYVAVGRDSQIIGTRDPEANDAEFFWFADASASHANNDKYAEFAPRGVASNKVMAEVHHQVVLVTASGASDQKWYYNGVGWTNVQTGDVLKSTYNGGPIRAVTGPSSGSSETFTFVTP